MRGRGENQLNLNVMEDIEQSLIKSDGKPYYGIDQFERLYQKKRLILESIQQYRQRNKSSKDNIMRAKQRLYQIQQLTEKAQRHSMLLRNQMQKINDAHMMTKILTIQKMIKLKKEHDDMENKKNIIFRIRAQKQRALVQHQQRKQYKSQKNRQLSLLESRGLKQCLEQKKYETIELKRSIAERVRSEKSRIKDRIKRYQQFKIDQAKKNYNSKVKQLKETLQEREKKLDILYREQVKQEKSYQTTEQVTKDYLGSIFATQTI